MHATNWILAGVVAGALCLSGACANERIFTYSYEPETMPAGAMEFEQWITLRTQRTKAVGQQNFNRWELREELEYGVTDNYQVSLYFNHDYTHFTDNAGQTTSHYGQTGFSLENKLGTDCKGATETEATRILGNMERGGARFAHLAKDSGSKTPGAFAV